MHLDSASTPSSLNAGNRLKPVLGTLRLGVLKSAWFCMLTILCCNLLIFVLFLVFLALGYGYFMLTSNHRAQAVHTA